MIPFFFVGSRRSGTTLACHIINMHPRLYTPFERYTMWILKWIHDHKTGDGLTAPKEGVFDPMWITIEQAGKVFLEYQWSDKSLEKTRESFFSAMENFRMARGTGNWRKDLVAIGEKNPPEYAQPDVADFIVDVHSNAQFVHIVRHPVPVSHSRRAFLDKHGIAGKMVVVPYFWHESFEENVKHWVQHEICVQQIKHKCPGKVLTVRYEDLCADPCHEAMRMYRFFGVSSNPEIDRRISAFVHVSSNQKYRLDASNLKIDGLQQLMVEYGYA